MQTSAEGRVGLGGDGLPVLVVGDVLEPVTHLALVVGLLDGEGGP